MKKIIKYLLMCIVSLIMIVLISFFIWTQQTYEPSKKLDNLVKEINYEEDWVVFNPRESMGVGVILYPGAKVEPEAYSYIAQQLSDQGYFVGIPKVRLNLPMFDRNKAAELINKSDSIEKWYVGGHSLGGVTAAAFASEHPDVVSGLILLASYPSSSNNFSQTNVPTLSIYAENDGLSTIDKIEKNRHLLSQQTELYEIKGGNHAQFGIYGPQKGDHKAAISVKEQQDIIGNEMLKWLEGR
ncbi:alpha/beta fold hydrolase [Cytobacillus horneckiae]|uniref:alpha/beta fold hydrolase n=1 Tax=Cytobacillus horneckiae TaxID=549687 RepID=UPI0034CED9AF